LVLMADMVFLQKNSYEADTQFGQVGEECGVTIF